MVNVNLFVGKQSISLTKVGGFDFSLINVKMFLVAIAILYIPEPFLKDMFDSEFTATQNEVNVLQTEQGALNGRVQKAKNIKLQIDAFKEQEDKLSQRISLVKEIINRKQSPYNILVYISKNISESVWIDQIALKDRMLSIKGQAKQWQDIGNFIQGLKNSIYFDPNIRFTQGLKSEGARSESFVIEANIVRFE